MERMAVATKPMQMSTSPITLHSAASPGGMRAASGVAPTENKGVAGLSLALVELGDAILDCAFAVVAAGSVPIIECVVPTVVVEVALVNFVSLVMIPPNARLAVPELKTVSIVVIRFWAERRPLPSRRPAKSRGVYGVKFSTRGCECAARRILIKTSVCLHIYA
jgi:hypothetical protein